MGTACTIVLWNAGSTLNIVTGSRVDALSCSVRTLAIGLGATAFVAVAGCGSAVTKTSDRTTPALVVVRASPAGPAISEPFSFQPSVSRLAAVASYPGMGITLDPVNPQLTPTIAAADAYSRCQVCPHGPSVQGFRQQLAYFSANTPATIPAACVPQVVPMPTSCADAPAVPIYRHRLTWVFTWYSQCVATGPPGGTPPKAFTCLNVVPFDATTGDETYSFSGGA